MRMRFTSATARELPDEEGTESRSIDQNRVGSTAARELPDEEGTESTGVCSCWFGF